jgi:hypothetical protein
MELTILDNLPENEGGLRNDLPVLAEISPWETVKKYAVFKVFLNIAFSLIGIIFSLFTARWFGLVGMVGGAVLLYFAFKEHKAQYLNGYLPFSRIVRLSWLIGLVVVLPTAIFTYVMYQYIAPNALDIIIENVRTQMELQMAKNPSADPEMIENIIGFYKKWIFTPLTMSLFAIFGAPMELLTGIIIGLFVRKEIPKLY